MICGRGCFDATESVCMPDSGYDVLAACVPDRKACADVLFRRLIGAKQQQS